jgi:hypothetical protein
MMAAAAASGFQDMAPHFGPPPARAQANSPSVDYVHRGADAMYSMSQSASIADARNEYTCDTGDPVVREVNNLLFSKKYVINCSRGAKAYHTTLANGDAYFTFPIADLQANGSPGMMKGHAVYFPVSAYDPKVELMYGT